MHVCLSKYDLLWPLGLKGSKVCKDIFCEVNIFILLFVKTDLNWSYFHLKWSGQCLGKKIVVLITCKEQ